MIELFDLCNSVFKIIVLTVTDLVYGNTTFNLYYVSIIQNI